MISEGIELQFNTQTIRKSFIGGVVNNYNGLVTLLSTIALLYVICICNIAVEKFKCTKKTKKCFCCCSCGGRLMSNSSWRVFQQQYEFMPHCKNNKNFNWLHHHQNGHHLPLHAVMSKKFNHLMSHAKRFACMMRV